MPCGIEIRHPVSGQVIIGPNSRTVRPQGFVKITTVGSTTVNFTPAFGKEIFTFAMIYGNADYYISTSTSTSVTFTVTRIAAGSQITVMYGEQ